MLSLILIVPGLVVGYALLLRPILHKVPALAAFYAEADGFWAKVWALCGNSLTILWGKALGGLGLALALLDPIANAVGDPGFKDQMTGFLQGNPQVMGIPVGSVLPASHRQILVAP